MPFRIPNIFGLALFAACLLPLGAATQNQDLVDRLLDRIVAEEQKLVAELAQWRPVIETYIQESGEDGAKPAPPLADHYLLGKLELSGGIGFVEIAASEVFERRGNFLFIKRGSLELNPAGFAQMIVPDFHQFNRQTYALEYVEREFLGEVRCLVFNVTPRDGKARGKFIGRIWVEDQGYRIVRLNGTYTRKKGPWEFFHFDSWRTNVEGDRWLPAFIYVEDGRTRPGGKQELRLRAQTRLWAYGHARPNRLDELVSILVDAGNPVVDDTAPRALSPAESQRVWRRQAEENVLRRLEETGLLAPAGEVDKVLDTVVNNLMVTNGIDLEVRCRVLLTTPLETFSIGQAIVVSRGLLDVLPDEASLAMALAGELAHIVLGHRTETMFAFSDKTMFADSEILDQLRVVRAADELREAGVKASEMLAQSPYRSKMNAAARFLDELSLRAPSLKNLISTNLGNPLAEGRLDRRDAAPSESATEDAEPGHAAALPLGSRVEVDPWSNRIRLARTKPLSGTLPREPLAFQVSPFRIELTRAAQPKPGDSPPASALVKE